MIQSHREEFQEIRATLALFRESVTAFEEGSAQFLNFSLKDIKWLLKIAEDYVLYEDEIKKARYSD